MRKSLFIGLVTLLPVLLTYIILVFGINLITAPFEHGVRLILVNTPIFDNGFGIFTREQTIYYLSKILIIAFLAFFIFIVGFFAARVLYHPLGEYIEKVLLKIPVIKNIYGPLKDLVTVFFQPPIEVLRQSALVPYPSVEQYTVGIITGEFTAKLTTSETISYFTVFVPSSPNSTNGFLLVFKKDDVCVLDLPADEALKYVMSFGATKTSQTIAIKE